MDYKHRQGHREKLIYRTVTMRHAHSLNGTYYFRAICVSYPSPYTRLSSFVKTDYHMTNRSRTDIIAKILELATEGQAKTRLMYGAALSYVQLKAFLEILEERGLLEYSREENSYRTTEKGVHFLENVLEMRRLLEPENPQNKSVPVSTQTT